MQEGEGRRAEQRSKLEEKGRGRMGRVRKGKRTGRVKGRAAGTSLGPATQPLSSAPSPPPPTSLHSLFPGLSQEEVLLPMQYSLGPTMLIKTSVSLRP